jgi:16S rRNA (guanine966-N2)-methyltransferase
LFSILGSRIDGAHVLDLFAGSGALGFESLSRGAVHATFVESHRATASGIGATADALGVRARCTVIAAPAERVATRLHDRYDIVFADPPYALPYPGALFAALRAGGAVDARTLLVYEHAASADAPADAAFEVVRTARYGAVALSFLRTAA